MLELAYGKPAQVKLPRGGEVETGGTVQGGFAGCARAGGTLAARVLFWSLAAEIGRRPDRQLPTLLSSAIRSNATPIGIDAKCRWT
jgi:hypothetical protein